MYYSVHRNFFTKAKQLRQRNEQLLTHKTEHAQSSLEQVANTADTHSSTDEEEDADFDEFLSWRAKISTYNCFVSPLFYI